ncbi:efflux RND transporter periplasmic adaptor subunit [Ancylomarina longa]|uniref:Efflux RND transporter periplasmic adaptor subunit n=1 Tax=Ancylomarina longa TaxID=2487017 RepID=A0A434AUE7_9BACT|nr:efflux RND transporter periplasmic adaptor subunit [Ancylomarina longa]RUT77959.1 efflux RND transporter periplasmic adaptor subunit [Ancylomarina longa]
MKKTFFLSKIILSIGLSIGLFSCENREKTDVKLVQPVKIYKVNENLSQSETRVFTGLVKESREVKLAFQIPGPLVKLNVEEGQYVKKGQLIAVLNDRDYQVQLESANANFENAKLQAERYAALYDKRSTSKSVFDQTQAGFKLAKAQKEAAENALKDTKIYAPFAGYIQTKYAENHEKVAAGHPIVSLLDLSHLELSVALSENDFLRKNSFVSYECQFEQNSKTFQLQLIDIDRKPNRDNFYIMRLGLNPKDNQIVPGMVANVKVQVKNFGKSQIKVPMESVYSENGKAFVWKFNPDKSSVERIQVNLAKFESNGMIRINKGIKNGDLIIAAGVHNLTNGQKVKKLEVTSSSNIGGQL